MRVDVFNKIDFSNDKNREFNPENIDADMQEYFNLGQLNLQRLKRNLWLKPFDLGVKIIR